MTAAHLALHRSFVGLTGSTRLVALADVARPSEIRLALATVDRIRPDAGGQVQSHADLLDLLEAGDVDGAAARARAPPGARGDLDAHRAPPGLSATTGRGLDGPGKIGSVSFLIRVVVNALALAAATWLLADIRLGSGTQGRADPHPAAGRASSSAWSTPWSARSSSCCRCRSSS